MRPPRQPPFTVTDLAREVGVHPNTVRLYEQWGLLPPIPRAANRYRQYSLAHVEQLRLARIALPGPFPGGGEPVYELVKAAAIGNLKRAVALGRLYAEQVARVQAKSQRAYLRLQRWARRRRRSRSSGEASPLHRREAARQLGVTVDALRTWERDGLLRVARDRLGYCLYEAEALHRVAIVGALREAGYSVLAIRRMFQEYERGNLRGLKRALTVPPPGADIIYVSDRWLSTLREHRQRARKILRQLAAMSQAR